MLVIDGERVRLRDWRAGDIEGFARWMDPAAAWKRLDAPYYPLPDEAGRREYVESRRTLAESTDLPTPRASLVITETDSDRLIGQVSWYFESRESDWRRMGILLFDPATWGGGRGTEAIRLWTGYLFATTDAVRLDFATWSGNPACSASAANSGSSRRPGSGTRERSTAAGTTVW
ncbi:MAG: GNAT family N-acetyltransferase [Jatrophihabitans sp.]